MLVTRCPKCGKPTPANLSKPDSISCAACGYAGEPSDEAKPVLKAARAHLDAQDARKRQIAESAQRALKRSDALLFALVFAVASIPCTAVFIGVVQRLMNPSGQHPSPAAAVTSFIAFAVMWALGIGGFFLVRRAQAKLRATCSAVPPSRAGEASKCRVCGGDLPAGGAFVRCRFCSADNWSDVASIRVIEKREASDASDYEGALAREVAYTAELGAGQRKLAPVFAILIPIGFLVVLDQVTPLLQRIELALDDSVRYTTAMTRDGECVGHPVQDDAGSYVFEFGIRTEFPGNLGKSAPPLFSATELVGKDVRAYIDATTPELEGRVERVFGSPVGNLAIVSAGGKSVRVDVRALCMQTPKLDLLVKDVPTFTLSGSDLFWPEDGRIDASKLDETAVTKVTDMEGVLTAIASNRTDVFFADGRTVYSVPQSGGKAAVLMKLGEKDWVFHLAATDKGDVIAGTGTPFTAIVLFHGEREPVRYKFSYLDSVFTSGSDLMIAADDGNGSGVFRVRRGESVATRILTDWCESIGVDANAIYCGGNRTIIAHDVATGAARTIFRLDPIWGESKIEPVHAIAADDHDVYFVFGTEIGRVSQEGGIAHAVMDRLPEVGPELVVAGGAVYLDVHQDRKFNGGEIVSFPIPQTH